MPPLISSLTWLLLGFAVCVCVWYLSICTIKEKKKKKGMPVYTFIVPGKRYLYAIRSANVPVFFRGHFSAEGRTWQAKKNLSDYQRYVINYLAKRLCVLGEETFSTSKWMCSMDLKHIEKKKKTRGGQQNKKEKKGVHGGPPPISNKSFWQMSFIRPRTDGKHFLFRAALRTTDTAILQPTDYEFVLVLRRRSKRWPSKISFLCWLFSPSPPLSLLPWIYFSSIIVVFLFFFWPTWLREPPCVIYMVLFSRWLCAWIPTGGRRRGRKDQGAARRARFKQECVSSCGIIWA